MSDNSKFLCAECDSVSYDGYCNLSCLTTQKDKKEKRVFCQSPTCKYFEDSFCTLKQGKIIGTTDCSLYEEDEEKFRRRYGSMQ